MLGPPNVCRLDERASDPATNPPCHVERRSSATGGALRSIVRSVARHVAQTMSAQAIRIVPAINSAYHHQSSGTLSTKSSDSATSAAVASNAKARLPAHRVGLIR
jgi:hypothetical protein